MVSEAVDNQIDYGDGGLIGRLFYPRSGEVEITLLEIARHLLRPSSESIEEIRGLAYRDPVTRSLRINPPRVRIVSNWWKRPVISLCG